MKHADDQAARRRKTNMTLFELRSTINTLQAEAEAHEGQMKELEEQLAKQQEENEFMGGMLQSRDRDMHAVLFQLECHQGDVEEMMLRLTERQQKVRSPAEVSLLFSPSSTVFTQAWHVLQIQELELESQQQLEELRYVNAQLLDAAGRSAAATQRTLATLVQTTS